MERIRKISALLVLLAIPACNGGGGGKGSHEPTLSEVSPPSATVGMGLLITGDWLGETQGDSTVTIGGVEATVVSWVEDGIQVNVPDVLPGARPVVVTIDGEAIGPAAFEVVLPRRVYVSNGSQVGDDVVTALSYSEFGELEEIGASPFALGMPTDFVFGGNAGNVALDVANRRLFVSGSSAIAVFAIDGTTGALAPVAGSPFPAGTNPNVFGIAISSDGASLYANLCTDEVLAHFEVAATGALTPAAAPSYPLGLCGDEILLTPDGAFLYTGNGPAIRSFAVGAGGALTAVVGGVASLPGQSYGKTISPNGQLLYAASYTDETVYAYSIGAGGDLALFGTGTFPTESVSAEPNGVALTPDATVAYVALWSSSGIAIMDAATDGVLTYRGKVPTIVEPAPLRVAADGSTLFALGQTGISIEAFAIGSDGGLTSTDTFVFGASDYPLGLAVTGF